MSHDTTINTEEAATGFWAGRVGTYAKWSQLRLPPFTQMVLCLWQNIVFTHLSRT